MKKQTFLQGALILVIANALVKVIGAGFKIPLTYTLEADGMGIYSTAYEIYKWLFVVATAGFPIAISKMVSESVAIKNANETRRIFRVAMSMLLIIGFIGMCVLLVWAKPFANAFGNARAYWAVMALAPSLFFVSIMCAFRGYFQGQQDMVPTATSEVIEALGKLVLGFGLVILLMPYGIPVAAAGAVLGVSIGTAFGAIVLFIIYKNRKRNGVFKFNEFMENQKPARSYAVISKQLFSIAIPITIGASVFSLTSLIDGLMVMRQLKTIPGVVETMSSTLYGYFSGYVVTLFGFPPTVIVALSISAVPALATALILKKYNTVQKTVDATMRIASLIAFPAAVGLSVLSGPILQLVFHIDRVKQPSNKNYETVRQLEQVLHLDIIHTVSWLMHIMGIAVIFVSLVLVTNAILQSAGKSIIPVINMGIGGVLKVIINFFLVGTPAINIIGAPIGTNVCYFVILVLNLFAIRKHVKVKLRIWQTFWRPSLAAIVMGITLYISYYSLVFPVTHNNNISTIIAIGVGATVYFIMMLMIGGIKREDVLMFPKGDIMEKYLDKLHLLR